jgi:hypothetical protein
MDKINKRRSSYATFHHRLESEMQMDVVDWDTSNANKLMDFVGEFLIMLIRFVILISFSESMLSMVLL